MVPSWSHILGWFVALCEIEAVSEEKKDERRQSQTRKGRLSRRDGLDGHLDGSVRLYLDRELKSDRLNRPPGNPTPRVKYNRYQSSNQIKIDNLLIQNKAMNKREKDGKKERGHIPVNPSPQKQTLHIVAPPIHTQKKNTLFPQQIPLSLNKRLRNSVQQNSTRETPPG